MKSYVNIFLLYFIKEFLSKLIRDLQQKIYKRIACNFDMCSFYKGFPCIFFFTCKSFVKFFRLLKLESDFFPNFVSKIRNNENCENLFILIFKCAEFQQNRGQKNSSLTSLTHFTSLTHSLHYEDRAGRSR